MDYQTFKDIVVEKLLMGMLTGAWTEDVEMIKENGDLLSGICIIYPSKYRSPVIYLEPFFHRACEGVRIDRIAADVKKVLKAVESIEQGNGGIKSLDWTDIQSQIYPRLVNYKKNKKFLSEVPHKKFLDLAVTYYIEIPLQNSMNGCMTVRMPLFELWGISLQELEDAALHNLQKDVVPNVVNAYDLRMMALLNDRRQGIHETDDTLMQDLEKGLEESLDFEEIEKLKQQYILSAPKFIYGAEVLLHMDVIKGLAEMLQADLYIVPLAVDAVEVIPVGKGISLEEIREEMGTLESMKMESVDFLSDCLYIYRRRLGKITRALI